jgi:AdoMet-dependent heme synthase
MNGAMLGRVAARAMEANIPLSVVFELTGRCNLDCCHCYLDIAHPPGEMSTEQAMRVVDQLADAGTLFLTLSGGELFLRKDAVQIAAHARRRGLALRLFTNATRITPALAAEIARVRPLAVEVSVYASNSVVHNTVTRRPKTFRRTLRGILLLKRAGVNVGIKAPLLSPVIGELDRLFDLAERLGTPMMFDPFVTPRHDGGNQPLTLRAQTADLASALADPRLRWIQVGKLPAPPDPDAVPCAVARRTARISPTGDVYPCSTYPRPVGNLLERTFSEIWAGGPILDRLRALRIRDLQGDCAGCSQGGYCGRCTAVALIEHGDELGPSRESCRVAEAKERALGLPVVAPPKWDPGRAAHE